MTTDRLFSSKDLGLKYKVVLQLSRLCLLANFPAITITGWRGGGGNCDEMAKIWYPVLPGQPRSNVGWDFPAKKAEMWRRRTA